MKKICLVIAGLIIGTTCSAVQEEGENIYHVQNLMPYPIWLTIERSAGDARLDLRDTYASDNSQWNETIKKWSKENPLAGNGASGQFHAGRYAIVVFNSGGILVPPAMGSTGSEKAPFFIRSITVHWLDEHGNEQSVKNSAAQILERAGRGPASSQSLQAVYKQVRSDRRLYGSWNFQIGKFNKEEEPNAPIQNGAVFTWWNWPGDATVDCSWPEGCPNTQSKN